MGVVDNLTLKYAQNSMKKSLYNSLNIDILYDEYKKVPNSNKKYMLYVHIPFCHTFCPYCSFHKFAYNEEVAIKYFSSLREEMKQIKASGYDFHSLYVGGGTTLINEDELLKTLILAKKLFNINEISCETDPNHIIPEQLKRFCGIIDRLSVGVQSFDDQILRKVARYDKFGSSEVLKDKLSKVIGILPVFSLDLIFNFPFQTKEMLLNDISTAKAISPEQITMYPLMKSNLTREKIAASLGDSNKDMQMEFYNIICEELKDYYQNNAWSFSKFKTNLKDEYVGNNHEYLGVGSGAFSFLNGELIINAFNLDEYNLKIASKQSATIAKCTFTKKERLKYLFLTELFDGGINIDEFNAANHVNLHQNLFLELNLLKLVNAIKIVGNRIETTFFGRYICLDLMKEFYIGMDFIRAIFRDDNKIKATKIIRVMSEINNQI